MENPKILVFGKDGQVGKAFQEIFSSNPHVTWMGRAQCDISKPNEIEQALEHYQPQIILNASAYTAVDQAEKETELAHLINGIAPGIMAGYIAQKTHGVLIHYSTDYVFDGSNASPYKEDDLTNPLGQYGKSKLAGELAIKKAFEDCHQTTSKYFILRTSWVYGDGGNFIQTMLRLASERETLKVIHDQFGVPTSAQWLAQIAQQIIPQQLPSGIYHAVPDGKTSWHGLAGFAISVAKESGLLLKVDPQKIQAIPATEYPLPAPRPYNSRMSNHKLKQALQIEYFPEWEDQVRVYVKKIISK